MRTSFLVASLLCLIAFSTSTFAERELLSCQEAAEQVRYAAQAKKGIPWVLDHFPKYKECSRIDGTYYCLPCRESDTVVRALKVMESANHEVIFQGYGCPCQ